MAALSLGARMVQWGWNRFHNVRRYAVFSSPIFEESRRIVPSISSMPAGERTTSPVEKALLTASRGTPPKAAETNTLASMTTLPIDDLARRLQSRQGFLPGHT